MKKFFIICIILLFSTTLISAEEKNSSNNNFGFKYGGFMYLYSVIDDVVDGKADKYVRSRFRQYFSYLAKNIETTLKFEIDPVWGSDFDSSGAGTPDSGSTGLSADIKGELQIKNAYLKFTIPDTAFTTTVGIFGYMAADMMLFCDDAAGIKLSYKVNDKISISGLFLKFKEGLTTDNDDDINNAILDIRIKLSDKMSLNPAFYAMLGGNEMTNVGAESANRYLPSVNFKLNTDLLDISFTAAYGFGKYKNSGGDIDYSGFGMNLSGKLKINKKFNLTALGIYLTGDDNSTGSESESFGSFLPCLPDGRTVILPQATIFLHGGALPIYTGNLQHKADLIIDSGLFLAGLKANLKLNKFNLNITGMYLGATEELTDGKMYGIEIDTLISYEIIKNLQLQVEFSILFPDDNLKSDTSILLLIGTTFKW